MRPASRILAVLAMSAASLSGAGCVVAALAVGAAAAYGTIKYTENEAYEDFHANLDTTWRATVASLRENGYTAAENAAHGPVDGHLEIGDAKVTVETQPGDNSRVRVRIGTFDNEDHRRRAALILEGVSRRID